MNTVRGFCRPNLTDACIGSDSSAHCAAGFRIGWAGEPAPRAAITETLGTSQVCILTPIADEGFAEDLRNRDHIKTSCDHKYPKTDQMRQITAKFLRCRT